LSDEYKEYLYRETVIPSEGARHTVVSVQSRISSHLEAVLQNIPRRSAYASAPLKVRLDFEEASTEVVATVEVTDGSSKEKPKEVVRRSVHLQFPNPSIEGQVEAFRMFVSAHEFGHAYMGARLGLRFEHVVVVPPSPGTGGYVKFSGDTFTAKSQVAYIYSVLAARAMERIIMNTDPVAQTSVLGISSGPSSDIRQATFALYNMIYELGMDPDGGTIDSNFNMGPGRYASIQDMPEGLTQKLGLIMRDMETLIVKDFIGIHKRDWYVERIVKLAKKGVMSEQEFYDLVGYNFPGRIEESEEIFSEQFLKLFGEHLTSNAQNTSDAMSKRRRGQKVAANVLREDYVKAFGEIIRKHLHPSKKGAATSTETGCDQFLK